MFCILYFCLVRLASPTRRACFTCHTYCGLAANACLFGTPGHPRKEKRAKMLYTVHTHITMPQIIHFLFAGFCLGSCNHRLTILKPLLSKQKLHWIITTTPAKRILGNCISFRHTKQSFKWHNIFFIKK